MYKLQTTINMPIINYELCLLSNLIYTPNLTLANPLWFLPTSTPRTARRPPQDYTRRRDLAPLRDPASAGCPAGPRLRLRWANQSLEEGAWRRQKRRRNYVRWALYTHNVIYIYVTQSAAHIYILLYLTYYKYCILKYYIF